ncbi:TPA: hypothetical protein ACH3X3_002856 [Trebouxia sp. C0006]
MLLKLPAAIASCVPVQICRRAKSLRLQSLREFQAVRQLTCRLQNTQRINSLTPHAVTESCLYSTPDLYDKAFSFRDFDEEVEFLEMIFRSHVGKQKGAFLELGCGPARHASLLQQKTGSLAIALDNSQAMLAYAKDAAHRAGASIEFKQGDMKLFLLQERVDMAYMLFGTFGHLLDSLSAQECLSCIHGALKRDGLLVIELAHPADVFDGSLMQEDEWGEDGNEPSQELGTPGELAVQYGKSGDQFDAIEQVLQRTITIYQADSKGKMAKVLSETVPQRIYTYQEMILLAELCAFELHAAYGDMQKDVSFSDPDAPRMVLVFKVVDGER